MIWTGISARAEAPLRLARSRLGRRLSRGDGAAGQRLPLAALRTRLDERSAGAHWAMHPDGVIGRSLMMPAPGAVSIPLALAGEVSLTGRVMLLPHDWRDGRGAVSAAVTVTAPDGHSHELWSGKLACARQRGAPRGRVLKCRLPAWSTSVQLTLHPGPHQHRAVARALWLEPGLHDPLAHAPARNRAQPRLTEPITALSATPLFSVLTPVHNPPLHMLEEAIASVQAQTFPTWELCLVDDGSSDPEIIAALQRHAATDPRIHLTRHEHPRGISEATNAALQMAGGQYIALLDHDDTLTPDALNHVAQQIRTNPDLDMIYSDEDILLNGIPVWVHLKPGWSPDTLRTNGYTCHLGVYRRDLVVEIGGFRSEFNGSQDVDMILRLVERTDRVAHIPRILYHWRAHASSTAGGDAKPYAYVAARNAIAGHLRRTGLDADVGYGPPGLYRVVHRVDPSTSVQFVLPVTDERGLTRAVRSWLGQPHSAWGVVLAGDADVLAIAESTLVTAGLPGSRITSVVTEAGADASAALAVAADAATAEHLILMQSLGAGLTDDWLTRLVGYSSQPDIAAAGAVVLAADGRIHEAGIAIPDGIPLPLLHGLRSSMDHFFGYGTSVYNVAAVSGVLATPRETYRQLGGLDAAFGQLALVDYCLRAALVHQRSVIVPDARLLLTGHDRSVNDLPGIWRLHETWARTHARDPYYNPQYLTDRGDFERHR